jgi:hypothetical protein
MAALLLAAVPVALDTDMRMVHATAFADDGDGDGGGGGGAASAGEGGGAPPIFRGTGARPPRFLRQLLRPFGGTRQRAPRRARAQPVALPSQAEREIVAVGLTAADGVALEAAGYSIVSQERLEALDQTILKLRIPDGLSLEDARDAVRAINDEASADFNHFYRASTTGTQAVCEGPACAPLEMVNWPLNMRNCAASVTIGMVDTDINPEHAIFEGVDLDVVRISDEAEPQSGRQHGTAVAALLVGRVQARARGLLPAARLVAVDAFVGEGNNERAAAYDVVRALDLLIGRQARIVNLSLAGDANRVLERMVRAVLAADIALVAAAGNDGARADPRFPAAYPGVLAVTAVDGQGRVYRRAGQGDHVDLAAPGVGIWTAASISGARTKTGTSFAAPFVTAAAALLLATEDDLSLAELEDRLSKSASDLGDPGRDPVYGAGLLDASGLCGAVVETVGR